MVAACDAEVVQQVVQLVHEQWHLPEVGTSVGQVRGAPAADLVVVDDRPPGVGQRGQRQQVVVEHARPTVQHHQWRLAGCQVAGDTEPRFPAPEVGGALVDCLDQSCLRLLATSLAKPCKRGNQLFSLNKARKHRSGLLGLIRNSCRPLSGNSLFPRSPRPFLSPLRPFCPLNNISRCTGAGPRRGSATANVSALRLSVEWSGPPDPGRAGPGWSHQTFGLAQRHAEHRPQSHRRGEGQWRLPRLSTLRGSRLSPSGNDCHLGEPDGQAAARAQGCIARCQVGHSMPLFGNVVTPGSVDLERHDHDLWQHGRATCCRHPPSGASRQTDPEAVTHLPSRVSPAGPDRKHVLSPKKEPRDFCPSRLGAARAPGA